MRKLVFFFTLFLVSTHIFSQEIILTFNPVDSNNTIDSITATNLETGKSVTVSETNIILLNNIATSVKLINYNTPNCRIYPNPFHEFTWLEYIAEKEDKLKIAVINMAGQIVASKAQQVSPGIHLFQISGIKRGMYVVNIQSNSEVGSLKTFCLNDNGRTPQIKYSEISTEVTNDKSAFIESAVSVHFRIFSGDMTTIIVDNPTESKNYDVEFVNCIDKENNKYAVVRIRDLWWMAENLAYLPKVNNPGEESNEDPFYYVLNYFGNNTVEAKATEEYKNFGVLYNFDAAKTACPSGWRLPSDEEWQSLEGFLGMDPSKITWSGWRDSGNVGDKLKSRTGWSNNGNGTDAYGFTALPGGCRTSATNPFQLYYISRIWSGTDQENNWVYFRQLNYDNHGIYRNIIKRYNGLSVRCVRD